MLAAPAEQQNSLADEINVPADNARRMPQFQKCCQQNNMQQSCHSDRQPACSRKQQPTPDQQFPGRHSEDQSQPDGFRPVLDVLSQQFCDRGQHLSSDRVHELIVEFADRRININTDNDQTQRMNRVLRFSHRHDDREYNELVSPWLKSMLIQ